MIKLAVTGAGGRMGSLIARLALEDKDFKLVGVIERPDHPLVGKEFANLVIISLKSSKR
jgi:4-hydroxy-tetrahydrodipicolinate reductase